MFVHFGILRSRARKRKEEESRELTLENSNLEAGQIATAEKALRILGLESRLEELSKQDFLVFLYAMGLNPTDDIIDSKLRSFKLHHKKTFTFGQLAHVWHSMLQDLTDEDEILKRAFQFFDKDENGEISIQELRTTMHELGDLLTDEEITTFMEIMDVNNDGAIGYEEFLATLKTQAPNLVRGCGEMDVVREGTGEGQPRRSVATTEPAAAPTGSTAGADCPASTWQPLNVPSTSSRSPTGEGAQAVQPPSAAAVAAAGDSGGGTGGDSGPGHDSGALERSIGSVERSTPPVFRGTSAPLVQLPSFPARRQTSLKAGVSSPPPAAAAEPLLEADTPCTVPQPGDSSSRRLGPSVSISRAVPSASGPAPHPPVVHLRSLGRADGGLLVGSGSRSGLGGGGDGVTGQGLRAPSALDPGSGGEGS